MDVPLDRITVGRSDVIYADGATKVDAEAVGLALVEIGVFQPDHPASVKLTIDHGRHVVAFIATEEAAFSDPELQRALREIASMLSVKVFASQPIDIALVDTDLEPRVRLSWESRAH